MHYFQGSREHRPPGGPQVGCPLSGAKKWLNMQVTRVSHSCLLIELGPICNSMAASFRLKSCEDHSLLKSYKGGL